MNRPEESLHRAAVQWLTATLPAPWWFAHVPNGGARSKAEAGILKAMGVQAGMPDLLLFGPSRVIAVELKAPPRRLASGKLSAAKPAVSEAQRACIAKLSACGVPVLIIRDLAALETALRGLGVQLKGRSL
jgi:hypothetical protein